MRVRFVEFVNGQDVNLPGKPSARFAHAFDPEHVELDGFDIEVDNERREVTITVPLLSRIRQNGSTKWFDGDRAVHGQAPVKRIPIHMVKQLECFDDMPKVAAKAAKP